jgi:hypothetical protein
LCRTIVCVAVLVAISSPCSAEVTTTATETIIRLSVQPMAAPEPALRYLLLPDLKEQQPGNPIASYLQCLFLEPDLFNPGAFVRQQQLMALPLKELPAQEALDYGGPMLRLVDKAARMDRPDWQILAKLRTDGIGLLIPDIQKMRTLASALQVRFRGEVAVRRFDDALGTARTMLALARHTGEHPTLIGALVGMATVNLAVVPLQEMLEQPGCPNLYWALTNLPAPLISLAPGNEGERVSIRGEMSELDDKAPMSPEQIKKLIVHIEKLGLLEFQRGMVEKTVQEWLDKRTKNKDFLAAARRRLVAYGLPEQRLLRFPPEQVVFLDDYREYEVRRDEIMKLMNFPTWQFEDILAKRAPYKESSLLSQLAPAINKVRRAQGRMEQRIALLRHVEALRMYAAEHDGKLPEKLADIDVPLPVDPFSGKPFIYKVEGATAHLRGTPPRGEEKNFGFNIHYEITIRK